MTRNLDYRSEVAVPIYDPIIQKQLKAIMNTLWADNTKARILGSTQNNEYRKTDDKAKVRAQEKMIQVLRSTRR